MRGLIGTAMAVLALGCALPAAASPSGDLQKILDDHWEASLRNDPLLASSVGDRRYDDQLGDVSLAALDRQASEAKAFVTRLDAIDDAALTGAERTNKAILRRTLAEQIEANGFGQRMILFRARGGYHSAIAGLGDYVPLRTEADFTSLIARYEKYPAINDAVIAISRRAVAGGYTQPCDAMKGFDETISGLISSDPTATRYYKPFAAARSSAISETAWNALQTRAKTVIAQKLTPANHALLAYYTKEYVPNCRKSVGVSTQPGGAAYYSFKVRQETTTALTPEQIHALGLSEVARIRAAMETLAKQSGYADRAAFVAKLRSDPKYYAKTPEELMREVARLTKHIDGKMPSLFGTLPRLPYGIREIPAEIAKGAATAYYNPGSPESGLAGTYYVNTSLLDQRLLWEVPVLSVHEAVPGHHHQIALQQELPLPPFRRHATFFTGFVEGWGLYSESLGDEMGLYDTPEKQMGRLSYEMWRACRLVVDTGLHAKGWDKARAVAYMTDNTALSAANIEAEVNRYIAGPGQALAYKIGQLKILELRKRAETALGPRFDLRRFHDAVLGQGAVPLDVLEVQVDAWLTMEAAEKKG